MPNTLLTISMIARRGLTILRNNLKTASQINREYQDQFAQSGAKIGATLNVRVPWRPLVQQGPEVTPQNFVETSAALTVSSQPVVPVQFTSAEKALSLDDYSQRVLEPAIVAVANDIDRKVCELYSSVWNSVLVDLSGATPNAYRPYLIAGAMLDDNCAPRDRFRSAVVNPWQQVDVVDNLKGLFQSSEQIANQYETGTMGLSGGLRWSMDQNLVAHTVGPLGGTPVVDGGTQTGTSLLTRAWTAAAAARLKKGDVFTIGAGATGVYGVNPQTHQSTGKLQHFVVTANVSSTAGGAATVPIQPAITTSGAYQTVVASPADGASINVLGTANTTYVQGLVFHRDWASLASVDMELPTDSAKARRAVDKDLGISMRIAEQWQGLTDQHLTRVEVLHAQAALRPEWCVRIWQAIEA